MYEIDYQFDNSYDGRGVMRKMNIGEFDGNTLARPSLTHRFHAGGQELYVGASERSGKAPPVPSISALNSRLAKALSLVWSIADGTFDAFIRRRNDQGDKKVLDGWSVRYGTGGRVGFTEVRPSNCACEAAS